MKCPKCLSDTAPTQLKKFGVCRVCQRITLEQLERIKQILIEQQRNEICEVCKDSVNQCDCNRCEDCGTIYAAADVAENLNEDNNCANCANEIGE